MVMKFKFFSRSAIIKSFYLIIILIISMPAVFSENISNQSNENITTIVETSQTTNNMTQITNKPLNGESHEGFSTWLTMISDIGTFIAAIAAFFTALIARYTLKELQKQRQLSDTPKIFVTSRKNTFEILWAKVEDLDFTLPFDWQGETIEKFMPTSLPLYNIPLDVINSGQSPALNIKIIWKFEHIPELINGFNNLGLNLKYVIDNKDKFTPHKILVGGRLANFPSHTVTPVREIDYILPYSNIEHKDKIFLPEFFSLFVSLALAEYSLTEGAIFPKFPLLIGSIEYSDLSDTIHKSEFEVGIQPILTKKLKKIDYEEGFKSATISLYVKMKKENK